MPTDPKLEMYLTQLHKALGPIPVSDRAEIITEIKSHILDQQGKDATQSISSILASLGEPQIVANRYLLERGLKPGKPPRSPILKWLTIGFLGTLGILVFAVVAIIWKFTPVISVDEEQGRVRILGGLIDIDAQDESFKMKLGKSHFNFSVNAKTVEGEMPIQTSTDQIRIMFTNGKVTFNSADERELTWGCRIGEKGESPSFTEKNGVATLDLQKSRGVECEIDLPNGVRSIVSGKNGDVELSELNGDMELTLDNGKVSIDADSGRSYHYETNVGNGHVDELKSVDTPGAIQIKIALKNGMIEGD